jgi:ABC-type transport system involved in cytochrome bd biosynthesis fused ATPase/permease subunit
MGTQRVTGHQLLCYLFCEGWIEAASYIDGSEFGVFAPVVGFEFRALKRKIGLFGIRLRMHRDILARRHGHRSGDQTGNAGNKNVGV